MMKKPFDLTPLLESINKVNTNGRFWKYPQ